MALICIRCAPPDGADMAGVGVLDLVLDLNLKLARFELTLKERENVGAGAPSGRGCLRSGFLLCRTPTLAYEGTFLNLPFSNTFRSGHEKPSELNCEPFKNMFLLIRPRGHSRNR